MKTAKFSTLNTDIPLPPDVIFHASPLSSTTGSTPSADVILATAQNDPTIMAQLRALLSSPGPSPDTEALHE